ncbi:MAG: hypothetical protein ABIR33_13455 [Pyrinomonadaceae bacterium]
MSEFDQFRSTGTVKQSVDFGKVGGELTYQLSVSTTAETLTAEFDGRSIVVSVPEKEAHDWITSDVVGIENIQPTGGGRSLRILVEKDFACLTTRKHEDETDAFPNPFVTGAC